MFGVQLNYNDKRDHACAWVTSHVQEPERVKEADGVLPSSSDESSWP